MRGFIQAISTWFFFTGYDSRIFPKKIIRRTGALCLEFRIKIKPGSTHLNIRIKYYKKDYLFSNFNI